VTIAAAAILAPLAAMVLIVALRRGVQTLSLLGACVAVIASAVTLTRVANGSRFTGSLPGLPGLPLRLVVDPLAAVLSVTVAVIVFLVLIYAVGYMEAQGDKVRFFAGMTFFATAMQTVVLAGDWILLLAAWELIGFASYLLIGFWFDRPAVGPAATRAFLTTRSADLGLYLATFTLVTQTGTTAIAPALHVGGTTATVAGLLLLVAAMGKSAQVPLQGWLQDAMLGPTPVSALLHSATLVAAGAILLARALPLLSTEVRTIVGLVGGVTVLVTGVMALVEPDVKRLLAASTSSQLGFMFLALGAGSLVAAVVHLVAHAAMKSSLFLGVGVFQEAYGSTAFAELQGAGRAHRRIFLGFTIAGLSLAALPPLAGFWSKDAVLAATFTTPNAALLAPLAVAGSALTGGYVGRTLRHLWHGEARHKPVQGIAWMAAGLTGTVVLAAVLGLGVQPIGRMLGLPVPENDAATAVGLVAAMAGLAAGWLPVRIPLSERARRWAAVGFRVHGGFVGLVVRPVMALATLTDRMDAAMHRGVLAVGRGGLVLASVSRTVDERGIDGAIRTLARDIHITGGLARHLQTGLVSRELALTVACIGALVVLLLALR